MQSKVLNRLRNERDIHRRRLLLVGYLCTTLAPLNIKPVLVGGNAVELYTFNDYTTHDIDIVTFHRDKVGDLLEEIGFTKDKGFRHWFHEELELSLEIPDDELAGDLARVTEVEVDEFVAYVIGIEDLLIDRLNAYIYWESISDFEQAAKIFVLHRQDIDFEYLREKAIEQELISGLEELKNLWKSTK